MFALVAFAGMAKADSRTFSVAVTNGQAISISDQLPISGLLDKVEVTQSGGTNATVILATYDSAGTTAVDTLVTSGVLPGNKVFRPRIVGTTTAGVTITGVNGTATNATTVLVANYEKPLVGGNLRYAVTAQSNGTVVTNTVRVVVYYEPVKH